MPDWSEDLCQYLATNSGGALVRQTNFFRAVLPATVSPDTLGVSLIPTQGRPPDVGAQLRFPRFQITCRCRTFATAHVEALRLYAQLSGMGPVRIGSAPTYTLVNSVRAMQEPFLIGRDANEASLVVCNYELELLA